MGQKTHPKGFRLITTQPHLSDWYGKKLAYPTLIKEDFFIRLKVEQEFNKLLSISKIEINRVAHNLKPNDKENESINIKINALYPRAKEMCKEAAKQFEHSLKLGDDKAYVSTCSSKSGLKRFICLLLKQKTHNLIRFLSLKTSKKYSISVNLIENPFEDAVLIAKYIAEQLEKRVPFRRAVKQTLKKTQFTSIKGLKIQVSGRLNGIDIARSEWKREGKIPLHTLNAKIDYTHQYAETVYGLIGIKVWLFSA